MEKTKNYAKCANCGEELSVEELTTGIDGELYCDSCFSELFATCERCGEICYRDDLVSVYVGRGWEDWCQDCCDDSAFVCECCGDMTSNDYRNYVDNDEICDDCLNNDSDYAACERCGETHHVDNMEYSDRFGGYVCDDCRSNATVIHNYHGGPRPLLWLSDNPADRYNRKYKLFVGVELEIDKGGENDDNAEAIVEAGGHTPNQDITCESDGSLDDGFELISTTATVDYHIHRYNWDDMMQEAIEHGYTSHDAGTCGLHVHMDREYFADMQQAAPETILTVIVANNDKWMKRFSRRTHFGYCQFPPERYKFRAEDFKAKDKYGNTLNRSDALCHLFDVRRQLSGHGSCMNFDGYRTLEIRFNRGTLNFAIFVATMQFVQMLADITKSCHHVEQACEVTLRNFKSLARRRGYKEFLDYLKRRNIQ